jgi:protein tyrosine/serine phosphatase
MGVLKNRMYAKDTTKKDNAKRKKSLIGNDSEQFSDADIVHSGYLVKQGSFFKTWRRRFFILRRDCPLLCYYESLENLVKLGEIIIDGTTTVKSFPSETFPHRFLVAHGTRKLLLVPDDGTQQIKESWIYCIVQCIKSRANEAAIASRTSLESSTRTSIITEAIPEEPHNLASPLVIAQFPSLSDLHHRGKDSLAPVKRGSTDPVAIRAALIDSGHSTIVTTNSEAYSTDKNITKTASINYRRRFQRSHSAENVLSSHSRHFKRFEDPIHDGVHVPNILQKVNVHQSSRLLVDHYQIQTRARNLSLPSVKPSPSIEFAVSVGTKGIQQYINMIVVLSCVQPGEFDPVELSRTEVVSTLTLRACGGDFFVRDFNALLSVPLNIKGILHIELFSILNLSTEALTAQQSLGFLRVSPVDVLFSREPTMVLEFRRAQHQKGTSQLHFLVMDRLLPGESLPMGHAYTYAKRHFVADTVLLEKRKSSSPEVHFAPGSTPGSISTETESDISEASSETAGASYTPTLSSTSSSNNMTGFNYGKMVRSASGKYAPNLNCGPLAGVGNGTPSHVLITEELSASYCSISVAVAYMKLLQGRNQRRLHDAKQIIEHIEKNYEEIPSSPNNKTQSVDMINLHNEMVKEARGKLTHYSKLSETYVRCEEYYVALMTMLEEGKEPGITGSLKRSTHKKDKLSEFMPTNLNCHLLRAKRIQLNTNPTATNGGATNGTQGGNTSNRSDLDSNDELIHAVITHGCAAAHAQGYKDGGLRRLIQEKATSNDPSLMEKIEQRQDVVRCQALGITASAFLSLLSLAAMHKSPYHQERLKLACTTGFLVSTESLLSTLGSEKGMIEDMSEGIKWLNACVNLQVVQSMEKNVRTCWKCIGVTSSNTGDQVVATFAIPTQVFTSLPLMLQQGNVIKVRAVFFTQGINEMQSVANTVLDTRVQDEINFESGQELQRFFRQYAIQYRLFYGITSNVTSAAMNDTNTESHEEVKNTEEHLENVELGTSLVDNHNSKDIKLKRSRTRSCSILEEKQYHKRLEELLILGSQVDALVEKLYDLRKSHDKKKNVNILLESSDICRKLGAGRTTCCKSGKDRTAMSVTLESSRMLVDHFHVKHGVMLCNAMRERGVRRINVLVNTGKNKFAFNALQIKCLPDCYKPPLATADAHIAS